MMGDVNSSFVFETVRKDFFYPSYNNLFGRTGYSGDGKRSKIPRRRGRGHTSITRTDRSLLPGKRSVV